MTKQTAEKRSTGPTTDEHLDQEIEALDKEAREALDKLADRREVLARRHRATELAAERQRERERERRLEEQREAQESARQKATEKAERLGAERLALEERAEEEAKTLAATLGELLALDPTHRRAVEVAHGNAPQQLYGRTFSEEVRDWFRGRFRGIIPGIGGDLREGLALPKRDALTKATRAKQVGE